MKRIFCVILPIALALILAVGTAFSGWLFESYGNSENNLTDKRDDIFENYDIKRANDTQINRVNTYEIYLYPSTLYLNDYIDSLENVSGAVLPEEKYGYIEPVVAKDGTVSYNVVKSGDNGGDTAYLSDVAQNTTYTMSGVDSVLGMYQTVYKGNSDWDTTVDNGLSGEVRFDEKTSVPANSKYLYGDPELDKTVVSYDGIMTGMTDSRHNWRNLHYYDRFGYWPALAKDAGRYLPLKITVDENFSNTYYDRVVLSPFADMGDPQNWYVYSFSCWAYVDNTAEPYVAPYYATQTFADTNNGTNYVNKDGSANPSLGAFCPTTVSQYFDIIESFEKYADEDGVIRLFPKFSNGKGYGAKTIKDGGGDAIKVVPTLKDGDGNPIKMSASDQHEMYMFYSTDTGFLEGDANSKGATVHVSVLPNIDIDNYYSLDFQVSLANNPTMWEGTWQDVYSFGREEPDDPKGGTGNKNIPQTLKAYGYGMYNLYLFITNVTEYGSVDFTAKLEEMRQNLVNKSDTENFPSLFGKNLLPIASMCVSGSSAGMKSFMLVAEKVRDAKLISDVNFGDSNYTSEEELEARYLAENKSFRLINKDLYGYSTVGSNSNREETPINSQFPYCYILQNVDFTEATTQYCQIRFQRNYRSDLHFASPTEYKYDRIEFSGEIYERGFGNYFDLVEADVYSEGGTVATKQQVIQLKSEEMRGVYDIILVFRSAKETDSNTNRAYNIGMYVYRHTNIFLKIYGKDLTDTAKYYQSSDGAISDTAEIPDNVTVDTSRIYEFIDHSATPLFNKSYPIGVSVKADDPNDGASSNSIGTSLAACVNGAVLKAGYDPTKVKLKDHVTGAEVAFYELKTGVTDNSENFYLEYGGEYYGLVFKPFKIRKNYIFYISYM